MTDRADLRTALARLGPERRRRILMAAAGLLLAGALVAVALEPEGGLALVALALGGVFLIARPHWGILAVFVLVIFRIKPDGIGPLGPSEVLAAPLLFPFAAELLRNREIWVLRVFQFRALLAIGGVLLVATEWSLLMHPAPPADRGTPWDTLILFGQQLLFLIYLAYFLKTPRHLVYAAVVVLLMVVAAAIDSLDLLGAGHGGERARVSQGWAANSNRLAFLCVWGTALAWALRFKGPRGWWRPLTLVPLLGLPIITLTTGSRNGLLQLVLLGGLIMLEQRQWSPAQRARAAVLMGVVALLILALVPAAMVERASDFDTSGGRSVAGRLNTHRAAATMIAENPVLGVGPGNFHWRNEAMTGFAMSTHDSYLWALVSGGPVLLALYLLIFYRTHRMLRALERRGPPGLVWVATWLRFNWTTLFVFSFFADMWLTHPFYLLLGVTIALLRIAEVRSARRAAVPAPFTVGAPALGRATANAS